MKPYLVTGGSGQVARALAAAAPGDIQVVGRPAFDFDAPETLAAVFEQGPPRLLINAAAWTAVDAAEDAPEAARRANVDGPARLAALCRQHGTRFIHISTDYVFDGHAGAPYHEAQPTAPAGVYGETKLRGEQAVLAHLPSAVILRTSWVYAEIGKNFVNTMLNASRRVGELRVVADQTGCPTNADDLAHAILAVAARMLAPAPPPAGVYHAAGGGETTWHGFAEAIFAEAAQFGWPAPVVHPILTEDWPTRARRPADSRLNCERLAENFGVRLPHWRPSLARAIAAICQTAPAH